ncbi:MAG TPA: isoprenylcysteine carboxylmethyltransferase family protein [Terriglobales bacterium]
MQRKRVIILLLSGAFGAVIGAVATGFRGHSAKIAVFKLDDGLLARWWFLAAALLGLVVFSAYWEVAAKGAAAAKSSESRVSRALHVTLTNAAVLMEIAPVRGLGRFVPVSVAILSAGLAVEWVGVFFAIWARRHLGRNWSGEISIKVDHELIRTGPYRWLRHPIYTGILTMYLGVVLVTGEWLAIAGFAMVLFAYWRKIRLEEANLTVAFGAHYDAYRRNSWAVVPWVF